MEADPFAEELALPEPVLTMLESPLPQSVEELLQKICAEQSQEPPDVDVRRRLAAIGEKGAKEILKKIAGRPIKKTLSAFIIYMLNRYPKCLCEDLRSPISTPKNSEFNRSPKSSPQKPTGLLRYYSPLKPRMLFPIDDLESRLGKKIGGSSSQVSLFTATTSTYPTIRTCSMLPRLLPPPQKNIAISTAAEKRSGSSLEKLKQPEVKKLKLGMDIARNASIACGHLDALELAEKMAPPADLERLEGQETEELFKSSVHKSMEAIFHILELHSRMGVCISELNTYQEEKESLKKQLSDLKKVLEHEVQRVVSLTSQIATLEAKIISLTKELEKAKDATIKEYMKSPEFEEMLAEYEDKVRPKIEENFQTTPHFKELLSDEVVAAYFKGKVKMQQQIYEVLRDRFPDFDICSWNLPVELEVPSFEPVAVSTLNHIMVAPSSAQAASQPFSGRFATPSSSKNTMIFPLVMLDEDDETEDLNLSELCRKKKTDKAPIGTSTSFSQGQSTDVQK